MRIELFRRNDWYIRFDWNAVIGINLLLGFNYIEGMNVKCTDPSLTDCMKFEYCEFQIGFLLFTIVVGKEIPVDGKFEL